MAGKAAARAVGLRRGSVGYWLCVYWPLWLAVIFILYHRRIDIEEAVGGE
jgi:hypothetical protein